ncbi:DUF3499 domain-containing protein [Microlunatus elymi]|uniref:DUF3499 domain-containing protein n=1 Tax=Microlunatus elymi TaxID=2596828 RepID=A0A516PX64_9ACTN|nr:DUF3499 domain-containing protein [Microlunatus elymi]QDP95757.1 DUF3499 domain-containing protein [Microlunatus elymi]
MTSRSCSRSGCDERAVATLTYVYNDSTAVIGPLASNVEPHGYDLCRRHSANLSAPRGWEVIRLATDFTDPEPSDDDLLALADAVREVGLNYGTDDAVGTLGAGGASSMVEVARRGHLTVLADPDA